MSGTGHSAPAPSAGTVRPIAFGPLRLRTNLFLSPLAGYTNLPFRLTVRGLGGLDLCTTDLVNVRSLLRKNPGAMQLVATCAEDTPLAVQLFGAEPEEMRDGAQMVEALGAVSVDINMGCPVDKVVRTGSGSLLMTSHARAAQIVAAMASAVKIPVTAKMRLGWDAGALTAPDLARALEDAGAAAVFVHGRTREQGFSGRVNLAGIRAVVQAVRRIPVIGNGDITTCEAARRMFDETGCAGISIGRGAFYNPWIFGQITRHLNEGQAPVHPGFEERVAVMSRHLDHMIAFFGEDRGCRLFRKIGPWYAKQFGPTRYFRQRIHDFRSRAGFDEIMRGYREWRRPFVDERGELLPRYAPGPLHSSFMVDEADDGSDGLPGAIAVPKGPVAAW